MSAIENIEAPDILQLAFLAASCGYLNGAEKGFERRGGGPELNRDNYYRNIKYATLWKRSGSKTLHDSLRLAGFQMADLSLTKALRAALYSSEIYRVG